MLKQLLIKETDNLNRSIIPLHVNLLYHFTNVFDASSTNGFTEIIDTNVIERGYNNVGVESLNVSKPSKKITGDTEINNYGYNTIRAVSFTRNKMLWIKRRTTPVGFMFDRRDLERFYKLISVQPDDELENYGKNFHYSSSWDEEVIFKDVTNVDKVCFGILLREDQLIVSHSHILEYLVKNDTIDKYDIYLQNKNGVIYRKFNNSKEIRIYDKQLFNKPYGYQSDIG